MYLFSSWFLGTLISMRVAALSSSASCKNWRVSIVLWLKGPTWSCNKNLNKSGHSNCSVLNVARWLLVTVDHGLNPSGGEKIYPLLFMSCDLMIAVYLSINSRLCKVIDS